MNELMELMRMFEQRENQMDNLEWALQLSRVMNQFLVLMQENLFNQDTPTNEFRELITVTLNNLQESIKQYVLVAMNAEVEQMTTENED